MPSGDVKELGQALSKALSLPLDEVSLVRVSTTEKYRAGMDTKGRRDSVAGAFRVAHPRKSSLMPNHTQEMIRTQVTMR